MLPDHLRVPVILRYWTGLSEHQIAQAIGRRPGTVKSRLHEARRRLAQDPTLLSLHESHDATPIAEREDATFIEDTP
jgi:predicted RNA polymerase sigma factor